MLGVNWFDLFFFVAVVICEIHWHTKGRRDDKAFEEFQTEITDQLCEISQRIDEAIATNNDDLEYVETIQEPGSGRINQKP